MDLNELPVVFPTATVTIEGWENWLFCDAIGAEPSYEVVHPGIGFLICVRASATSLTDLFEMADFPLEDGSMLVGSDVVLAEPLQIGVEYEVGHSLESLERKQGRSLGDFDLLTHRLTLTRDNVTTFSYTGRMVLPRRARQ